jgi:nicotinamide-nucleotide amidase
MAESIRAEIIAVGTELLTPHYTDTNSLFITEKLNECGFEVRLKSVVGDNKEDIVDLLQRALLRSQLIVLCGGLGPTEDDLTRVAVAEVLHRPLTTDPQLLLMIRKRYLSRSIAMPKINERQAEVIDGAEIIDNAWGTVPGMWIQENASHIVLLPGPPNELIPMMEEMIVPRLKALGGGRQLARRLLYVSRMTESAVDALAAPIYTKYPEIRTTILSSINQISLSFSRWIEPGEEEADLNELTNAVCEVLGDAVFSTQGQSLEQVVGNQLRDSQHTLAVAESCTSGMVGTRITNVPGSSDYFLGGILCYSNAAKENLCGVSRETLERFGAVSTETAEELARGVRQALGSTIGLSITGIAGPGGGSAEKQVGLVYVGLSDGSRTLSYRRIFPGDRDMIRKRAATYALSSLRKFLL